MSGDTDLDLTLLFLDISNTQMKGAKRVNFKDIVKLETLSDDEHIVLVYLASRVMRLSLKDSLPFLLAVQRNMKVGSQIWFYFVDKLHFYY